MNTDELREELQSLGRQPVPAPRPDFVEGLLTRIQLTEDLQVPAPIQLVPRQQWAKVRMVAVGAVAAALLAAVGLFSLFQSGSPSRGGVLAGIEYHGQAVGAASQTSTLKVTADGHVTLADSGEGEVAPPGTYEAECKQDARIQTRDNGSLTCSKNERVSLTVEDGQIVSARSLGSTSTGTELAGPTSSAAAGTTAPGTAPTATSPTSTPANPPATAVATPATTSTVPGTTTTDPEALGTTTASTTMASTFQVTQSPDAAGGSTTLTWPGYAANADSTYLVLRTTSDDAKVDPQTPWYGDAGRSSPVVATLPHDATSYTATFDGSDVPVDTPKVSYRVAVVDPKGKLLAISSTLTLELRWEQLKPAEDLPTTPSTVTTGPTTPATTGTTAVANDPADGTGTTTTEAPSTTPPATQATTG